MDPPPKIEPSREELSKLSELRSILATLNDNTAGVNQLVQYVGLLPSLSARIVVAGQRQAHGVEIKSVQHAMCVIGNRGFQAVLLDYLEALTILKADVEDEQRARQAVGHSSDE